MHFPNYQFSSNSQICQQNTDLEESLQPPDLENTLPDKHGQLEDTPPFHPSVGALCGVPVYAFPDNDVRLLILDLSQGLRKSTNWYANLRSATRKPPKQNHASIICLYTFCFQRILRQFRFRNVHDAVNVERDLLGARCPTFVAEAVNVFSVRMCDKGIIFRGSGLLIILAISERIFDLKEEVRVSVQSPDRRFQFPGSAKRVIPRNQSPSSHYLRTLCRQPEKKQSSCRRDAAFHGSILASVL